MAKQNLYVSYISNDRDIRGVLALKYNLHKLKSNYEFGCIAMDQVSKISITTLQNQNIRVFRRNLYDALKPFNITDGHYRKIQDQHLFGKFFIFDLEKYDKIIYLDSDTMILNNIDHLFEKSIPLNTLWMVPDMQATPEYKKIILIKDRFNSGVIITKPNPNILDLCFKTLCDKGSEFFHSKNKFVSDQSILELLYQNQQITICTLDLSYNIHPILVRSVQQFKLIKTIYVIHFMVRPKPWEFLDAQIGIYHFENTICKQLFQLWLNMYHEMIQYTYLSQSLTETNIQSYHWGHYEEDNQLEVLNQSIQKL
jgi:glycogenin